MSWRAAAAYTDAEVDGGGSAPQLIGLRPAHTPGWTVTGGFEFRPMERLRIPTDAALRGRALGGRPEQPSPVGWDRGGRPRGLERRGNSEIYIAAGNVFDEALEGGRTDGWRRELCRPQSVIKHRFRLNGGRAALG